MAVTALAGFTVTPGIELSSPEILILVLSVLGASAAAGAFNQYAERDLDALMERTKSRPFVTGAANHGQKWLWIIASLLLVSVGTACWMFNLAVGFHVFMGAFIYGIIYTLWLKRRTVWNIVVGGAAGSFAVLAGASAADPTLNMSSILLAVVLFLWTPPHFWALAITMRKDYTAAGVPMLPVVKGDEAAAKIIFFSVLVLVAASLLPGLFGMGWIYLAGATVGGACFIWTAITMMKDTNPKTAIHCFIASIVQLTLLLITAIADPLILG